MGHFFKEVEAREKNLESGMCRGGRQGWWGSREAAWLGRGTSGQGGAWRNSPGAFDSLSFNKITVVSHCSVPESYAILQGGSFFFFFKVSEGFFVFLFFLIN